MLKISQAFDGGAIEPIAVDTAEAIRVDIRADSHADFRQWFYFRLQGARGQACTVRFLNAGKATYPKGFEGYQVRASYDTENWFCVPTTFDGEVIDNTAVLVKLHIAKHLRERMNAIRHALLFLAVWLDHLRVKLNAQKIT